MLCFATFSHLKYPSPTLTFFPFPLLSTLRFIFWNTFRFNFLFNFLVATTTMFFHEEAEAVHSSYFPVLETMFTPSEIEELFSLVNEPASPGLGSGSQGSNREVRSMHERKLRRMQSNRESARRSRWRKKRHLENLTNQLNRLRTENQEYKNRLFLTMHQNLLLSVQNERLRSESVTLMARLSDLYQNLGTMMISQ